MDIQEVFLNSVSFYIVNQACHAQKCQRHYHDYQLPLLVHHWRQNDPMLHVCKKWHNIKYQEYNLSQGNNIK